MEIKNPEKIKIIYHPEFEIDYHTASCECPDRTKSIMHHIKNDFEIVQPQPCSEEDILLCHTPSLLQYEMDTPIRYEVARLAVGGAIKTAQLCFENVIPFGVIRPPGHHAGPNKNWGFCFFNNMAIAIQKLLTEDKINHAVILDIDLHFGDGTDEIFEENPAVDVLNIESTTPEAFVEETKEALNQIKSTDIIGISAGFDQYIKDWGNNLSNENYYSIGQIAGIFAKNKANNRIFSLLEGGYYIPDLGENTIALLAGIEDGLS